MIIKSIEVKNFRAIRDELLNCEELTALVGRNGSGKSSFLYALEVFYDVSAPISRDDYFDHDINSPIDIRVTFGDLRDEEKAEFSYYIKDDQLVVTKRITNESGRFYQRYYSATLQIPHFAELRAISGKKDRVKAWNELVDASKFPELTQKAKTGDDADRLMSEYEIAHPDLMQPIEREEQFFGPRSIGGGKLDKFTKYVLIPAVRQASDETSGKKGAIYQLLDMIVIRKVNSRKDIQDFKLEFEQRVKDLYSSENLKELPELGLSISRTLEKFAPGSELRLKWEDVKPPEVQPPIAKATLVEDDFEGEISYKGHGLQRALIVTLLQHLAMTIPVELPDMHSTEDVKEEPVSGPDLILAIEEPELYLHPSRCRYLADLLIRLAEQPEKRSDSRNQVIYVTHSPYFVDLFRFNKIRMVRKVLSDGCAVSESKVETFSLGQAASILATVCAKDPAAFTEESFRAHAMSVMNTIINEGFFADAVVVVEGQTEVGALWKLQEIMKKNWPKHGIAIVPAGGKNNIDRPVVIFRGFKIPTYFLFDGDAVFKGRKQESEVKKYNHCYLRLANVDLEDFPETRISKNWAVFENNIENTIKEDLGEADFVKIRDAVAAELGYQEPSRALKNVEGSAHFISVAYGNGKRLPTLENIINAVTDLCIEGKVSKRMN